MPRIWIYWKQGLCNKWQVSSTISGFYMWIRIIVFHMMCKVCKIPLSAYILYKGCCTYLLNTLTLFPLLIGLVYFFYKATETHTKRHISTYTKMHKQLKTQSSPPFTINPLSAEPQGEVLEAISILLPDSNKWGRP